LHTIVIDDQTSDSGDQTPTVSARSGGDAHVIGQAKRSTVAHEHAAAQQIGSKVLTVPNLNEEELGI
jgi:3-keto-L-gulonate-6-phosphate decarboxylase